MKCYKPIWLLKLGEVPCGKCLACRLNKASSWAQRLMHEKQEWEKTSFVTLTYNEENAPKNGTLVKGDVQKFLKRLRKYKKFRYYLSGEYGDLSGRPHYHAILFNVGMEDSKTVEKAWGKGFVYVGDVTDDSCNYVAGYVVKKLNGDYEQLYDDHEVEREFAIMSRKPGIGGRYVEKKSSEIAERGFSFVKGQRVALPRYYESRIYAKGTQRGMVHDQEKQDYRRSCVDQRREELRKGVDIYKKELEERKQRMYILDARKKMRRREI